jgi:hypothetical protein
MELYSFLMTDDAEREKDRIWANLCRESGWLCRICGAVPEHGQQFTDDLCDDCRKIARNE